MNRTKKQTNPITALYCRLSMEDGRDNESMSITNQKAIRSNTYNFIPRDEWEVIDDCHEAIVTKEHYAGKLLPVLQYLSWFDGM